MTPVLLSVQYAQHIPTSAVTPTHPLQHTVQQCARSVYTTLQRGNPPPPASGLATQLVRRFPLAVEH